MLLILFWHLIKLELRYIRQHQDIYNIQHTMFLKHLIELIGGCFWSWKMFKQKLAQETPNIIKILKKAGAELCQAQHSVS